MMVATLSRLPPAAYLTVFHPSSYVKSGTRIIQQAKIRRISERACFVSFSRKSTADSVRDETPAHRMAHPARGYRDP
jgi:hypothetical protein